MKKVLIFPAPFLINAPTPDQQTEYMISLLKDEIAMDGIGDFIEVNAMDKSDYREEVRKIIAERQPDWVIAAGESATACLSLHRIYARLHTYGFFGALPQQQKSYELFQTVYPNVAWYVNAPDLSLIDIKDIIYGIINSII